jgi:hypothetical protein
VILPEFSTKEEYMEYLTEKSALPQGFASGTASGKFISVEAPAMGPLPIRGTVIHLTDGPTDSWAAVFTKNKARFIDHLPVTFSCEKRLTLIIPLLPFFTIVSWIPNYCWS